MSMAGGDTLTRARCLRAMLHEPESLEGKAGSVLVARYLEAHTPPLK